jgi:diacylglycerol kinase (ATP)
MKPGATGLKRIINATGYSWLGLKAAFKHESAFRQELLLCLILVPVAIWFATSAIEYALLLGSLILILIVELLNSAIEAVVDRFGGEMHELS